MKTAQIPLVILFLIKLFPINAKSQDVQYINSDSVKKARGYSHAVLFPTSGVIKTSGIIGTDPTGALITTSPRDQIKQAFDNLEKILTASGTTIERIDEIETFLTDSLYFRDYVQARIEFFKGKKEPPISKTYYIKGLINPKAIVEINVTAVSDLKNQSAKNIIYISAVLISKDGKGDLVEKLLAANIPASRNEKGCLQYDLYRGGKDGNTFVLQEQWTSQESFELHFKMPYMKELSKNLKDLVESSSINNVKKIEG